MRTKRVLRYYCDHCKKGSLAKHAMTLHEQRCIRNPERRCGFCAVATECQVPMKELIETLENKGLDALRELSANCPGCILAAIVQARAKDVNDPLVSREDITWIEFDYKAEVAAFWERQPSPDSPYGL